MNEHARESTNSRRARPRRRRRITTHRSKRSRRHRRRARARVCAARRRVKTRPQSLSKCFSCRRRRTARRARARRRERSAAANDARALPMRRLAHELRNPGLAARAHGGARVRADVPAAARPIPDGNAVLRRASTIVRGRAGQGERGKVY